MYKCFVITNVIRFFVSTNHINKMKTTFTLPQAIGLAVTLFIIFGIIVLKFGHNIN